MYKFRDLYYDIYITDQPPIPGNVTVTQTTVGIQINWDQITQEDCAVDTTRITYNVTVTRPDGEHEGDIVMSGETSAVVSNLTSNQEYEVSVTAKATDNTHSCDLASLPAVTNTTFSPPASDPTSKSMSHISIFNAQGIFNDRSLTHADSNLPIWVIPLAACCGAVISIVVLVTIILVICICCTRKNRKKGCENYTLSI